MLLTTIWLNIGAMWLVLLLHISKDPGSNLDQKTSYPEVLYGFPYSIQATAGTVP
jgi:hypothetical protein